MKKILGFLVLCCALLVSGCRERVENWEVDTAQRLCKNEEGLDYFYVGTRNSAIFADNNVVVCNTGAYFQHPYPTEE